MAKLVYFSCIFLSVFLNANVNWADKNSCNDGDYDHDLIIRLINKMTLEQKVGQIIMPDLDEVTPEEAKRYHLGTFLNGGGKFPNKNKNSTVNDWKNVSRDFYNASTIVDGYSIPILWGTDAVHGHNNVIGATIFPHNIGLGATMNPELVEDIGKAVAKELLSTGISWTFAPTIAVPRNDRWGRTYEGYSENPELVSILGEAMIKGLQGTGESYLDDHHVLATAKHFLGDGGTNNGIDQGNTISKEMELKNIHGLPYYSAIDSCIQVIMASFNSWNGKKMHGYEYFLNDVLKDQMNFHGLVVGDWNGHGQVPGCTNDNCAKSFNAGVDIFMAPDQWKSLYENTLLQVKNGDISEDRLNEAIYRILRVKSYLGLFDGKKPHNYDKNFIGNADHFQLARKAVRESLVLLKNNESILPLNPKKHYLVVGNSAIDIKNQMGGWTISWQGRDNLNTEFPGTKSIYQAIESKVKSQGGTIEYSFDGSYEKKPDVAIMVFGEEPYAEGDGDRDTVIFNNPDKKFLSKMQKIQAENIDIVSLFISGRPLVANSEINFSNAFVAIWLPGSAVEGITDVIFRDKNMKIMHDFTGKLSYSWPMNSNQSNINFGDEEYDPLFPYGYGLSYKDNVNLPLLKEESPKIEPEEITFFVGSAYPPNNEFIVESTIYSKVNADFFKSPTSNIKLQKIDYLKQDDSKNINFSNSKIKKQWGIENKFLDNLLYMQDGYIEIIYRVNQASNKPNQSIFYNAKCTKDDYETHITGTKDCFIKYDISFILNSSNLNKWQSLKIPFSCMQDRGFNLSSIESIFAIQSNNQLDIDIHTIKAHKNFSNSATYSCEFYNQPK
ncbi:MAG: glycosyl hydrolase family 3 [Gammaproteobacteria bacterium]|nr:glycosyl hydrolase family 3 [Gammaproteobacteria bacterium]